MHNFVKNAEGTYFKTILLFSIWVKKVKKNINFISEDSEEEYYDDYAEEEGMKMYLRIHSTGRTVNDVVFLHML